MSACSPARLRQRACSGRKPLSRGSFHLAPGRTDAPRRDVQRTPPLVLISNRWRRMRFAADSGSAYAANPRCGAPFRFPAGSEGNRLGVVGKGSPFRRRRANQRMFQYSFACFTCGRFRYRVRSKSVLRCPISNCNAPKSRKYAAW